MIEYAAYLTLNECIYRTEVYESFDKELLAEQVNVETKMKIT